ncbi:MAG: hypothetical protein U5K74_12810 [Gemmatimonadaceae bacterium]|nr:hypothetical protein [Gemmatimonadaceae bacterium]
MPLAHRVSSTDLRIKTPSVRQLARNLSGGNQQKVVLAKWLARAHASCSSTSRRAASTWRSKQEIYELINRPRRAAGDAILLISSDLPEVLGMSDRVLVMRAGPDRRASSTRADASAEQCDAPARGGT